MKSMKLIIAFLFASFLATNVKAQDTYVFKIDSAYRIAEESNCGSLRVLDMRKNKDDIGYLRTGVLGKVKRVVTEKPFKVFLEEYFNTLQTGNKGNKELLLVLYGFEIEDQPNQNTNMATIYFDGDFYSGNGKQYKYLGKVDSLYELRASQAGVTTKLLRATRYKIADLLSGFATSSAKDAKSFTENELLEKRKNERQNYPIYTGNFKQGIYYTADQFINNEPTDTPIIAQVSFSGDKREIAYYYANKKGNRGKRVQENSFFAIYNDTTWAVGEGSHCVPMYFRDGEFYAKKWLKGPRNADGTMMAAGFFFGAVGVLAAEAAMGGFKTEGDALYRAKFDPDTRNFVPVSRLQ